MIQPDFRGARASNAGDDFHEIWVLSQALTLLDGRSNLSGLTVEGLRPDDAAGVPPELFDGVDCALFYSGGSVADAERVEIVQFKYSASDPETPWTVARLTYSSAKTRDNSVLRRLGDAFKSLYAKRGNSAVNISVRLVSNQPAQKKLGNILTQIRSGGVLPDEIRESVAQLQTSSGLSGDVFGGFVSALDLSQTGSRFTIKESVLQTISSWTEGDARALTNSLIRFVHQRMLPESKGEWITRESVLTELGFSDIRALFPCPPELATVNEIVTRKVSSDVVDELRSGGKSICLSGSAGCGKTTALREIEENLPPGSLMVVFDCYGAGRYLDSDAYRHRPRDAFRQISNELASRLQIPLLLTKSESVDYARAFRDRLLNASQVLSNTDERLRLVIALDAADNSITAARTMVPQERSFVSDFVTLGNLPPNVCLVITSRAGNVDQIGLPTHFKTVELPPFAENETAEHVRRYWKDAPDDWINVFNKLSGGTPRVQAYALRWAGTDPDRAIDYLQPDGKGLFDIFRQQFEEARKKTGVSDRLDKFCAGLAVLPHPAPLAELSAVTGITGPQLADICADLAPGIRTIESAVGFGDEDFETFIREAGRKHFANMQLVVAERFMANHHVDGYAATHVAAALYASGRKQDLVGLVQTQPEPAAVADPVLRREIKLQRLRIAIQVCSDSGDGGAMLRTLLVGAGAIRGREAILDLVLKFPDVAAAFMRESAVRLVLNESDLLQHHGPLLFHLIYEEARNRNRLGARAEYKQLTAWLEKRRSQLQGRDSRGRRPSAQDWTIQPIDIAAEIEAILLLNDRRAATDALRRWRPWHLQLEVARIVSQRLIASGRFEILESCIDQGLVSSPWDLTLRVPLALAGRSVDVEGILKSVMRIQRRGWVKFREIDFFSEDGWQSWWFSTILTACEILVSQGRRDGPVLSLLKAFADEALRHIDNFITFRAPLTDLQLRARALLVRLEGRALSLAEFLIEPSDSGDNKEAYNEDARRSSRHEEARTLLRPVLGVYDVRAQILCGSSLDPEAALRSVIDPLARDSSLRLIFGASHLRRCAAVAVAALRFIASVDSRTALDCSLLVFGEARDIFGSSELAVLEVLVLRPDAHGQAVEVLSRRAQSIARQSALASEKIKALMTISRFIAQFSRADALAIFNLAHAATEEMDMEGRHQLKATSAIAVRAAAAQQESRRKDATGLYAVITEAWVRLSDTEGFPWRDCISALAALDPPTALASIARWQDTTYADLDTSLSAFIRYALKNSVISPAVAIGLLPLLSSQYGPVSEQIGERLTGLQLEQRLALIEVLAKDATLDPSRDHDTLYRILVQSLPQATTRGPWLCHLERISMFQSAVPELRVSEKNRRSPRDSSPPEPAQIGIALDAIGSQQIADTVEREISAFSSAQNRSATSVSYLSPDDVLENIKRAIPVSERVNYLRALASTRSSRLTDAIIARALSRALDEWKNSPSVQTWCRNDLGAAIIDRFPGFCRELVYTPDSLLTPALNLVEREGGDVVRVLAKAISRHVQDLNASLIYELVRILAGYTLPRHAASALAAHIPELLKRIPAASFDDIGISNIPEDLRSGIARFLFALMSDCDVRNRWLAAHSFRRIVLAGEQDILPAFLDVYDRQTEESFRAPKSPFYWIASRLWWNIAVCRLAHERPDLLSAYGDRLVKIATDGKLPHVLIRAFAKDAAQTLLANGQLKLPVPQKRALAEANTSRIPNKSRERLYPKATDEPSVKANRQFEFDGLDTIQYWYQPALGMFADVTQEEFLDVAEEWIVKRWHVTNGPSRWKDEPRPFRFSERKWRESTNDQGRDPMLERFSTYLEKHAMFCTTGELIESRALVHRPDEPEDDLQTWLVRRGLRLPPWWLADLRGPTPAEIRFWCEPSSVDKWVDDFSDANFINELGLTGDRKGRIVVDGWHDTRSIKFGCQAFVASALVEPAAASALVRAFQSAPDPHNYKLPDEGEDYFEINEPPYRLLGWLRGSPDSHTGIDDKDPLRMSIRAPRSLPGSRLQESLIAKVAPEGWPCWSRHDGATVVEHEAWSTKPDDYDSDSRLRRFGTEGRRMWVSVSELSKHLQLEKKDLIVSVKLDKEENYRDEAGQEKTKRTSKGKILLLRANGDIEDSDGRVGAWQTHRKPAAAPR